MNYSKLKDICITTQGIQISKDKQINKFKEGYIKYLYIADFKGENEEKFVENVYPEKIVTENDLVMANTGSPGAVFKGINGVLSNNLFKISFDRNILDRDFLYYYLASDKFQSNLQQRMKGGVQKHLGHKTIGEQDIPIIDINTQKRIVTVLNKSQKLIDKRKEQIEALDELVKSKFIEMFGEPFSNTKGWEKQPLNKLVTDDCTISYGIVQTGEEQREGIPVFRPVDIVNNRKPKLEELKKTTEEISNKYKKTILQGNELLMTVRANIGDVCVIDEEFKGCNVGRGIVPIRVKEEINPIFLKYQFESYRIQHELKALSKGITLIQLNMEDLRQFMLIVPPKELQNQFADFLKQVDKLKFEMEKSLKELEDNFNSLMQKAFKGELFN